MTLLNVVTGGVDWTQIVVAIVGVVGIIKALKDLHSKVVEKAKLSVNADIEKHKITEEAKVAIAKEKSLGAEAQRLTG